MYSGKFVSELSMSEVIEYYDELRENNPRTVEEWHDFNMLKEKLIVFAHKILDSKTNGDVMSKIFPDLDVDRSVKTGFVIVAFVDGTVKPFTTRWWDAPYISESEVKK